VGFNWPPRCPKRSTPGEALVYPRQYGQNGQSGQCGQCDNSGSTLTVEMILDADSERLMQMLDSEEVGDGCERIGNSRGTERDVLFEADTLEHPKKLLMVLGTSGTGRWCFPASGPLCSARGGRHHPQQTPFIGWPSLGLSTPPSAAQRKSAWGLDDLRGPGFGVTIFRIWVPTLCATSGLFASPPMNYLDRCSTRMRKKTLPFNVSRLQLIQPIKLIEIALLAG